MRWNGIDTIVARFHPAFQYRVPPRVYPCPQTSMPLSYLGTQAEVRSTSNRQDLYPTKGSATNQYNATQVLFEIVLTNSVPCISIFTFLRPVVLITRSIWNVPFPNMMVLSWAHLLNASKIAGESSPPKGFGLSEQTVCTDSKEKRAKTKALEIRSDISLSIIWRVCRETCKYQKSKPFKRKNMPCDGKRSNWTARRRKSAD